MYTLPKIGNTMDKPVSGVNGLSIFQFPKNKSHAKRTAQELRDARAVMDRAGKRYGWDNRKVSREPVTEEGKKWLR